MRSRTQELQGEDEEDNPNVKSKEKNRTKDNIKEKKKWNC